MSATKPKISVLIPVHNGAGMLRETVNSILNQTLTDFELLLLDDASEDGSDKVIQSFADSRIRRFHSNTNLGISAARNKLMELAEGEYLAVLDHDDLSAPNRLEKQARLLDNNPEVAMVGSWGELFCARPPFPGFFGRLKQAFINLGWVWCQPEHPDIRDTLRGNPVMHSSSMLRRAALLRDNITYNPDYSPAEDYDLCRQLLAAGWQLANIPEVLFYYHYHGRNYSLTHKEAMRRADRKVKTDILNLLGQKHFFYPYFLIMLQKLRLKKFLRNGND